MSEIDSPDIVALNAFIVAESAADISTTPVACPGTPLDSLKGVPIGVKDNIDVSGMATTAGTPALRNSIASVSSPVIERLTAKGAIIFGKTNMHELAFGISSKNEAFGYVRNPLDTTRSAGGSSGGSAAAVAAGFVPLALGTDTAGSIRIPASFCGCVGFRPTTGRYPGEGIVPLVRTRDTAGPIARNVHDIRLADRYLSGEPYDRTTAADTPKRLGIATDYRTRDLSETICEQFGKTVATLANASVELVDIELPGLFERIGELAGPLTAYEVRRDLFADVQRRVPDLTLEAFLDSVRSPDVASQLKDVYADSNSIDVETYNYIIAKGLPRLRDDIHRALSNAGVDAVIFPTTPTEAFSLSYDRTMTIAGVERSILMTTIRNVQTATLAALPSISLPMPRMPAQLPGGVTIEGRSGADSELLSIASAVEAILSESIAS